MKHITLGLLASVVFLLSGCKEKDRNTYRVYCQDMYSSGYGEMETLKRYVDQYGHTFIDLYSFSASSNESAVKIFSQKTSGLQQVDWKLVVKQAQEKGVIHDMPPSDVKLQLTYILYRVGDYDMYVGEPLAKVVLNICP